MRKLKFKLDRKSLEIIYMVFIRPLLEYADVIWDNCTLYEKQELDKIQNEAARIAIGTTKLTSLDCLYNEVKWESLEKRRRNHKLTLFYKMYTNLTTSYLSDLVPQTVSSVSRYNLRNSHALQIENTYNFFFFNVLNIGTRGLSSSKQFHSTRKSLLIYFSSVIFLSPTIQIRQYSRKSKNI